MAASSRSPDVPEYGVHPSPSALRELVLRLSIERCERLLRSEEDPSIVFRLKRLMAEARAECAAIKADDSRCDAGEPLTRSPS
jgi:hypothetical protein